MADEELALKEVFVVQFERLRTLLPPLAGLLPELVWPTLEFGTAAGRVAQIEPRQNSGPVITVYTGFLKELEDEFARVAPDMLAACLTDVEQVTARELRGPMIEALFDLTATFLLAHELHHYTGGHIAMLSAGAGGSAHAQAVAFHEAAFGIAPDPRTLSRRHRQRLRERYYLEHESDGTGLQAVMQGAVSPAIPVITARLGDSASSRVEALADAEDGLSRLVVFRLVVACYWTTVGMLEGRTPHTRENVSSHPLPGARLLAGLSTILEQFAEFTDSERDDRGLNSRVLTDSDVVAIQTFLRGVLPAVVRARLASAGAVDDDAVLRSSELALVRELGNLFQSSEPQTPAGVELLVVQRMHARMRAKLAEHAGAMRVSRRDWGSSPG